MAFTFGSAQTVRLRPADSTDPIPCAGCGRKVAERMEDGTIVVRRGGIEHARVRPGNETDTQCPHPPLTGRKPCRKFTTLRAGMPLPPTKTASMAVPVVTSVTVVEATIAREPLRLVA